MAASRVGDFGEFVQNVRPSLGGECGFINSIDQSLGYRSGSGLAIVPSLSHFAFVEMPSARTKVASPQLVAQGPKSHGFGPELLRGEVGLRKIVAIRCERGSVTLGSVARLSVSPLATVAPFCASVRVAHKLDKAHLFPTLHLSASLSH